MINSKLAPLFPILLLACAPVGPEGAGMRPPGGRPAVFISPMGEAFRAVRGGQPPLVMWFMRADANHDGRVDAAEFQRDALGFFGRIDGNGDGGIVPSEVTDYELATPELRGGLRPGGMPGGRPAGGPPGGGAPGGGPHGGGDDRGGMGGGGGRARPQPPEMQGAARFGLLAIPHPVASADADLNRTITRDEFAAAARRRFAMLDQQGDGALTLAGLQGLRAHPR